MILHICDGAKGGVGKSQTALILINFLSKDDSVVVFETDTQIQDVARICEEGKSSTNRDIHLQKTDLRTDQGWQTFLEILQNLASKESNADINVVMSLPGADLDVKKYTDLLNTLTDALDVQIWEWFVLNNQTDSVDLLRLSLDSGFASIAAKKIAVKNGNWADEHEFTIFDNDAVCKKIDKTFFIPKLTKKAADRLRDETCTIDEVAENAKKGVGYPKPDILYSANLATWTRKNNEQLAKIFEEQV